MFLLQITLHNIRGKEMLIKSAFQNQKQNIKSHNKKPFWKKKLSWKPSFANNLKHKGAYARATHKKLNFKHPGQILLKAPTLHNRIAPLPHSQLAHKFQEKQEKEETKQ